MKTVLLALVTAALTLPSLASAEEFCGKLVDGHYGPYDYRSEKGKLEIVDRAHFTEAVEAGKSGTTSYLGGDLSYTLRASPNHHRALATLARIALRDKTLMVPHMKWPVECYFLRAERYTPDDPSVYSIYASYLYSLGKVDKALVKYKQAVELDPESAMINYNIGLVYLKKNNFEQALTHAHKAYDQGYPLPGLKNQLVKAGKWVERPAK
ncbi:MAG: tetratricopeptide repeat protein [Telluria sp.]